MNKETQLWWMGQIISIIAGGLIWMEYSFAAGFAIMYALGVLVDIRGRIRLAASCETESDDFSPEQGVM